MTWTALSQQYTVFFSNYFWLISSFPLKILFCFKETFKRTFTQKPSSLLISWVLPCNRLFWTLLEPFFGGGGSAVTFEVEANQCDRRRLLFLFSLLFKRMVPMSVSNA